MSTRHTTTRHTNTRNTTTRNHFVVVDATERSSPTLSVAEDVVARGDHATVVFSLGERDRDNVREYAASEQLSFGEAESIYVDATARAFRDRLGADTQAVVVTDRRDGRGVLDHAAESDAASVVIPADLARRRSWRRALGRSTVPVVVAPDRAA